MPLDDQGFVVCAFCGQPSNLLCDGRLPDGKTCDRQVCRQCAKKVSTYHLSYADKKGRRQCRWDTVDLCPDCVKEGRTP